MERPWLALDVSRADEIVVSHLQAFVSLTVKGLLAAVAIFVAAAIEADKIVILGVPVPRESAALLVSVLFLFGFVAIALHGLNVLLASAHLPENEAEKWCLDVFLGAGVLSPLCCWPGRLGTVCSAFSYGAPFLLWWAMDIVLCEFYRGATYPLRGAFIAAGVLVGLIMGFSYVRLYKKLSSVPTIQRNVGRVGVLKLVAAIGISWLGYRIWIGVDPTRYKAALQLVDIGLAYPLGYAIPAWSLLNSVVLVSASGLVLVAGLLALWAGFQSAAWPAIAIGASGALYVLFKRISHPTQKSDHEEKEPSSNPPVQSTDSAGS